MMTTDHATRIRAELKSKHGWNSRQVSVKSKYYSMGSSISVRINDPAIPLRAVEAIANESESIRRDGYGEILGGGNRYIHVDYSGDAEKALAQPWIEPVKAAFDKVEPGSNVLQPVEGTPFLIGRPNDWRIQLWEREHGHVCENNSPESIAYGVGKRMLEASHAARG